ncbi:MAG: hypothetical protein Ct9H300mP1_30060 [Planctomycetaceae bacterium]|nr:MAG: hypothetical protein Ct9H300mP1_30060 [Planctomycetaceae bacterium]
MDAETSGASSETTFATEARRSWIFLGSGKHLADDAVTAVVRLVPMLFFRGLGRLFLARRGPPWNVHDDGVFVMCVAISGRPRCNFDDPTGVTTVQL